MTTLYFRSSNVPLLEKHHAFTTHQTVKNLIESIKPLSKRQLIDLPLTSTMEDAFDLFLAENILSVPVYCLQGTTKRYLAIVSALDLLRLLGAHTTLETLSANQVVLQQTLENAIGLTKESTTLATVRSTDSLQSLIRLLSSHGAHRVLVQTSHGPVFLSQMDVVRYLHINNHLLGAVLDTTVPTLVDQSRQKIQKGDKHIVSTTCRTTALSAFLSMSESSISALPVVDEDGCLLTEISPQDLRGLNKQRFDTLAKPVLMYIKESRGDIFFPFICHERFTLSQVMASIVLWDAHRLWWCDDKKRVKGLITLTDLLSVFLDSSSSL
ncbi:hypothetical protein BDF14DRAFT_1829996 [Spinellus fusiger]|nr:hypothetical protein BDF14DRAFT_1829996 [Spinellus fusiger]